MSRSTIARINTGALQHNLQIMRQRAPDSRVAAVVKADGYGHGLLTVAKALQQADMLAVATVEEGVQIREMGISGDVLVLEGFHDQEDISAVQQHKLLPVMHADHQLKLLKDNAELSFKQVWLKLETGMNRLGFQAHRAAELHQWLQHGYTDQVVLMTHLANAELPHPSNAQQVEVFDQAVAGLPGPHSISNSAAAWGLPETRRDWIRPGIILYGISPFTDKTGTELGLKPAMHLCSEIIAIHDCKAGDSLGYGSRYQCSKDTRIAVVAIGYGDGYPRHIKDGAPVWVAGQQAKLAGIPSMDMLTVELPDDSTADIGDEVELWGEHIPVEQIAAFANTVAYELVCQITGRVKKDVV